MDADQFQRYMDHLDHPPQLEQGADVKSLYWVYMKHVTRFAYSNLHLYLRKPVEDLLALESLLNEVNSTNHTIIIERVVWHVCLPVSAPLGGQI